MTGVLFCEYAVARRRPVPSPLRAIGTGIPNPVPPLLPGLLAGFFFAENKVKSFFTTEGTEVFLCLCACGAIKYKKGFSLRLRASAVSRC